MIDVLLVAASGLAREVISADLPGHRVVGILDDNPALHGTTVGGVEVRGGIDLAAETHESLLICAGPGSGRRSIAARLAELGVEDDRFVTAVDASVRVPQSCTIGSGSILLPGVVLTADVTVGRHVVIMPNGTLTHDDVLEDFATLAAGVTLGGTVRIGAAAYIGMNASVRQGLHVGPDSTLGMGAVLLSDLPAGAVWAGTPAAELRKAVVS